MPQASAMRGVPYQLQTAATSGNGLAVSVPTSFREHRITIKGGASVSAGAIQPEAADSPSYSGTWAPIGSPVTVTANAELAVAFEGIYQNVRARISTPLVGGTVDVFYVGAVS